MEPLFFKAENVSLDRLNGILDFASMEPLFFKAENAGSHRRSSWDGPSLQWSRFFSKRKISTITTPSVGEPSRFNGAAFFQSGKWLRGMHPEAVFPGFNGAAFFQSGK